MTAASSQVDNPNDAIGSDATRPYERKKDFHYNKDKLKVSVTLKRVYQFYLNMAKGGVNR
jgi:hypothetical protein